MNTLTHLRESMRDLTATERRIASYILDHLDDLADISISTVAVECATSKSMVVQMCKKAGYKGFKDLCNRLAVERALISRQEIPGEYEDIRPGCTAQQICAITMHAEIRSLQSTLNLLKPDAVERAAETILAARRVRLFGVGNSAVVAQDMYNKLQRIGLNAHFAQDTHVQLTAAATMTQDDCAVVFSYSGETLDMVRAVRYAQEGGSKVVSITRYGHSPVADRANIPLYVAGNESLVRAAAMASRLAMLSIVDMLFTCVVSRCDDGIIGLLDRTASIIRDNKK